MEPTPVTIPDLNHKADVLDGQSRDNKNEYFRNLQDNLKGKKRKNWNNWLTSDEINESKLYKAYQDYLEKHPPDDVDSLADAGSGSEPESDQGSGRRGRSPNLSPSQSPNLRPSPILSPSQRLSCRNTSAVLWLKYSRLSKRSIRNGFRKLLEEPAFVRQN